MHALSEARRALSAVDLQEGLAAAEVQTRLDQGLRLRDTGQRVLAFYLTEMEARRLHNATGHGSTVQYARDRLGLSPRRTRELIAVGRKLLELPRIDVAFCEQRIGWSKVVELARIATPEHEEAWLVRALELTVRELALEVRLARGRRTYARLEPDHALHRLPRARTRRPARPRGHAGREGHLPRRPGPAARRGQPACRRAPAASPRETEA